MASIHQQDAALWDKKVMILDVGSKVSIDILTQSILHKRASRATTKRHLLDFTARQSGMTQTGRIYGFCNKFKKINLFHRVFKLAYHACATKFRFRD